MSKKFEMMLAKGYDPKRVLSWKDTFVEPKMDGVRVAVLVDKADTARPRYYSRNGRELKMLSHLNKCVLDLRRTLRMYEDMRDGIMLDAEVCGPTFEDVAGAIHRKATTVTSCYLYVFHAMPLKCFRAGMDTKSQGQRARMLATVAATLYNREDTAVHVAVPRRVLTDRQVREAYAEYRALNYEGAMVKDMGTAWTARRTHAWMKLKEERSVDVRVIGMKEGTGKYRGMCGALYVNHNGKEVRVSGMTDAQRVEFWNDRNSIVGHMVEVEYQEVTKNGSLRHPRFKRVREDKE